MEYILVGIGLIGCMTVQTHTVILRIVDEYLLVEVAQVTLIESHLTIQLEAGSDTPVGDSPLPKRLFTDGDGEVAILRPLSVFLCAHREGELRTAVLFQQIVPGIHLEISIVAIYMQRATMHTGDQYIDGGYRIICHREVQGSDTLGDRHIHIVRIDHRQLIHLLHVFRLSATGCQQQSA